MLDGATQSGLKDGMKLKLTNPTDDVLSAAVAEYVAGWVKSPGLLKDAWGEGPEVRWRTKEGAHLEAYWSKLPVKYATSADAVLPLLEKCQHFDHNRNCVHKQHWVWVKIEGRDKAVGSDPIFSRAACIALLRANGIEVEVTR